MAEKNSKSQAERAASSARAKRKTAGKTGKNAKSEKKSVQEEPAIPLRFITSGVCLGLFILFLAIFMNSSGALLKLIRSVITGLIGNAAFVISIPALLYLFFIHAFSGKRPILMRSMCLLTFVFLCGCIAHLSLNPQGLPKGIAILGALYTGGNSGTTGGLLCGLVAMLVRSLCGTVISYIIFVVCAIFALLGSMQITLPGLIRAIKNRPRAEWEKEKEEKPKTDPAELVVNHLANKRIEYVQKRKNRPEPVTDRKKSANKKASDLMRQIQADVDDPVAAAGIPVLPDDSPITPDTLVPESTERQISDPMENAHEIPQNRVPIAEVEEPVEKPAVQISAPPQIVKPRKVTAKEADASAVQVAMEIAQTEQGEKHAYSFPPIELLKRPGNSVFDNTSEMRENTRRLNEALASFKIEAHIINVTRGPSVTRYEVELEKGVRLNKLTSVADDIALSLGASGVRIAAVPGKISVVGIEVPNRSVTMVSLREVIDSPEFTRAKSKSSFAVGKDIGGSCIVGNIAKLPHMLIAGTTGSGKSVCMNSIIISLLYKASPEDVKLIMVDPKMVELGIYNGIPHLLIPVVTDPKKAAGSLQWAVTEMMRRYRAMSDAGVRDLESYNSIMQSEEGGRLPQVVVIIDELADLMLVAAKEVEESICRIAQMGRAAGIHLIIATQRPSADVITGLMKANIPSRIAFAVASAMESRIILDTQGAEKLVGKGDMLFAPIGDGKPKRVQGCFVSDAEVEAVASYVKEHDTTSYDQQVMEEIERKAAQAGSKSATASDPEASQDELAGDEMLPAAVDVILETGQASVSMLQRRLKLGYARAARIVDEMEERGIVGPFQGSKPRDILITKEQWQSMKAGQSQQMDFDDIVNDTANTDL